MGNLFVHPVMQTPYFYNFASNLTVVLCTLLKNEVNYVHIFISSAFPSI